MTKLQVHFDIDKTLVDTKKMLENIKLSVSQIGVSKEVFESAVNTYLASLESRTFFDPEEVIQTLLIQSPAVTEEQLRAAFWKPENFSQALFPEVLSVLTTLASVVELGTFSQGVLYWQEKKLRLAELDKFFASHTRIIENNKLSEESLNKLPSQAVVIDDKEEVITHLRQKRSDLQVFWINRDPAKEGGIRSLTEVVKALSL